MARHSEVSSADSARPSALQRCGLLDSAPDPGLDRLTQLAALALQAPMALIALVDGDRVLLKSRAGFAGPLAGDRAIALLSSYCQLVVASGQPLLVADARSEWLIRDAVLMPQFNIAAYAGVPLRSASGHVLGVLALLDHQPRTWTGAEVTVLEQLVAIVAAEIEARSAYHELETELLQAQKLESLGRLTRGIAHDYNNLLTAMLGYVDLALPELPAGHQVRDDLLELGRVARRAAALTQQLLTFACRQVIDPRVLNLNEVVLDNYKLLRRLLGEDIELVVVLEPELGLTRADAGMIEQVLMNLVLNARDAMPEGGTLTIETANFLAKATAGGRAAGEHGYVVLSVRDTGTGMPPDVCSHVFEPLFTTKAAGQGMGLGLATCHSIVKQYGGQICLSSKQGQGTMVKVYLPRIEAGLAATQQAAAEELALEQPACAECKTVLLVEDEDALRLLIARVLRQLGYTVFEALHGEEAWALAQQYQGQIDLLLTDIVLPRGNGRRLAEQLLSRYPDLAVIFISGYVDQPSGQEEPAPPTRAVEFLQKPFLPSGLARTVREVLERSAALQSQAQRAGSAPAAH